MGSRSPQPPWLTVGSLGLGGQPPVSGAIGGQLFGTQAVEIVGAGATVTDAGNTPTLSFAGAIFGVR